MLQSFALQNSSVNFKKYKAEKRSTFQRNTFYQCKTVKEQNFWKTSFWLHKLVIRTHFKHQIQRVLHAKFA